jgi:hypothetical protein
MTITLSGSNVSSERINTWWTHAAYYGKNGDGHIPTEAEIKAGNKMITLVSSGFSVNPNTSDNEYAWFAVHKEDAGKVYRQWYVDLQNNGPICSQTTGPEPCPCLIKSPVEVEVDGQIYYVYIYCYSSGTNQYIKLS